MKRNTLDNVKPPINTTINNNNFIITINKNYNSKTGLNGSSAVKPKILEVTNGIGEIEDPK